MQVQSNILSQMGEIALQLETSGKIHFANAKFAEYVDKPIPKILGRSLYGFSPSPAYDDIVAIMAHAGKKQIRKETTLNARNSAAQPANTSVCHVCTLRAHNRRIFLRWVRPRGRQIGSGHVFAQTVSCQVLALDAPKYP